ncbi:amino acid adenylation domain-containing protein, partial [Rhodococcus pyridinivorans]
MTRTPADRTTRRERPARARRTRTPLFPQLLATAVERDPAREAVRFEGRSLTYAQLDERSSKLARVLIARGLGPGDYVAVSIPRSIESVLSVWAVVKTGAAFVPVDPNYPDDRIRHMVGTSGVAVGLTVASARSRLPETVQWLVVDDADTAATVDSQSGEPVAYSDRVRTLRADDCAYVIYTSGSTGVPKGVMVTHGGLNNLLTEQQRVLGASGESRVMHFATPSFDTSLFELLLTLGASATMVIVPTGIVGGAELEDLIATERVTHVVGTPSMLASVDPSGLDSVEMGLVGGEVCPPELVQRWGTARFHNAYGPTETTIITNISPVLAPGDPVTIGGPIPGVQSYVLDARLQPVPVGVAGELYLAGPELARGYIGQPAMTAERFVADPVGGGRMYRTGDVVRWIVRDGNRDIEYLGRSDSQVKLRGFRVELGEIDTVLSAHPSADFVATVVRELASGDQALVSYVLPTSADGFDADALLAHARQALPRHMVPSALVQIDSIPLTPVGKLDTAALPDPVFETREYRAPQTDAERRVADAVADVLGLDSVGLDDDFFELGGNSLLAAKLAGRLGAAFDRRVQVKTLFEVSGIADLAAALDAESGAAPYVPLEPQPRGDRIPLSLAQQRMWFLNRFEPESTAYNIPVALRLSGDLDHTVLADAVRDLVARHEVLRTVYPEFDGVGHQVVLPAAEVAVDLEPVPVPEADIAAVVAEFVAAPFDVTADVPVRVRLFRLAPAEHVLVLSLHHISADGYSLAPLTRDVMTAYLARSGDAAPAWRPLAVQYADYALWQRRVLGNEADAESVVAQQIAYWTDQLAGAPDVLELPTDRPRPAVQSVAGGQVPVQVPVEVHRAVAELAQQTNATTFMVVHAAWAVLLSRLSGSDDITVGTPIAGRGEPELDDLIGMFVNTLALRTPVDRGETFADFVARVRATDLGAFAHADVPFERLVEVLDPVRSTAHHPVFQVGLSFQNLERTEFELPGLALSAVELEHHTSQFDLHLIVGDTFDDAEEPAGIVGSLTYASALFDETTAQTIADRFARVLADLVAEPQQPVGDGALLDDAEHSAVLTAGTGPRHDVTAATLPDLFAEQVRVRPESPAVVADDVTWTYGEFGARVFRLARHLIASGVGPDSRVVLAMPRSVELLVAMYAVSAAGGAYVPIDPDQPAERVAYLFDLADAALVLTDGATDVPSTTAPIVDVTAVDTSVYAADPVSDAERVSALRGGHAAYVIFTSGSTGRPKGVAVPHSAVVNQLVWKRDAFGLGASDAVLLKTAATFDLSVWEFWSASVSGGVTVVARAGGQQDPEYLTALIADHGVTTLHTVPTMLEALMTVGDGTLSPSVRQVLAIGEALPADLAQRFRKTNSATLVNLYGPAEAAVSVTAHVVSAADRVSVPIGVPEWNTGVR